MCLIFCFCLNLLNLSLLELATCLLVKFSLPPLSFPNTTNALMNQHWTLPATQPRDFDSFNWSTLKKNFYAGDPRSLSPRASRCCGGQPRFEPRQTPPPRISSLTEPPMQLALPVRMSSDAAFKELLYRQFQRSLHQLPAYCLAVAAWSSVPINSFCLDLLILSFFQLTNCLR